MTFTSLEFLAFALVFFAVWPFVRAHKTPRWTAITLFSFFFYACWDWRFLFLLMANGLIDYLVGLGIERYPTARKALLVTSIAANVGTLALFKYSGFFASNVNYIFGAHLPVWNFVLPIGISFYTFHSMSYIIDVYRGAVKPTRNLLHFYSYLSLFPHLVAGPIIRGADFLPQLEHGRAPSEAESWEGMRLIAHGFFKKMVIADTMAPVVNMAFNSGATSTSALYWWLVMVMFGMQIYCDFSGYSDIARGLARWMGYQFPLNFNHPYTSISFREFWQRWHISLSSWFRDYVYIPLGGSRKGEARSHVNMWLTMLISGFWHGANWTFLIWGGLHALYTTVERLFNLPKRMATTIIGRIVAVLVVFALANFAWVFFVARSLPQALHVAGTMLNPTAFHWTAPDGFTAPVAAILLLALAREAWIFVKKEQMLPLPRLHRALEFASIVGLLIAAVFLRGPGSIFIYFQF